jgi:DNA-binding response OmpR family regulator
MPCLCLLIQSDPALAKATHRGLEPWGVKTYRVGTLASAIDVTRQWRFDVALLDADAFAGDVPSLLAALRNTHVPILVSSSAPDEGARIEHLEQGATALVGKDASARLTALRLKKLAEVRVAPATQAPARVRVGPLLIDPRRVEVRVGDVRIETTACQFEILLLLATRAGEFVHRTQIAHSLRQGTEASSRSIDMHICRLRQQLRRGGDDRLALDTVYGRGYCLTYQEAARTKADLLTWCA